VEYILTPDREKEREQMKYFRMIGGLALTLAVAGNAQPVQANCEDRLDNNAYRCQITFEGDPGDSFEDCLIFNSEDPFFGDFDLFVEGLGTTLGCSCEATKKKFDGSNTFLCVNALLDNVSIDDGSAAVAFEGKVTKKGKKIKKGQVVFNDGASYIFTCELDPTCELK
jgi:hypothetical protein